MQNSLTPPEIDTYFSFCQQMLKSQFRCGYKPLLQYLDVCCLLAKRQPPTRAFAGNHFQMQQLYNYQIRYLSDLVKAMGAPALIETADLFLNHFFFMLQCQLQETPALNAENRSHLLAMTPCIQERIHDYVNEMLNKLT